MAPPSPGFPGTAFPPGGPMRALFRRLLTCDRGQDLIEYALLTGGIGVVGAASWPLIAASLGGAYNGLNTGTQDLWVPPDPGGGS
ncbi:MAG: Flp family type IVb pilin [Acidobacteriota bacterium]